MSDTPPLKPQAYSYLRFSTPEQQKGDSARRQIALAAEYAERHGLELDNELTYRDLGVSAFRGTNVSTGRLGEFMAAVDAGEVPRGSYLLVESLDRISRQDALEAQYLLYRIIKAGILLVTLADGRTYSEETVANDQTALLYALLLMIRANEESLTKARRLKAVWSNKRANIDVRPLTSRAPAWLTLEGDKFALIPERAETVRRIFELTLKGWGQHRIAQTFIQEGMEPWGRGKFWQRTYVAKILRSPAVIGTFTPQTLEHEGGRKVRRPTEPIEGYFPAAVPLRLWQEVQARAQTGRAPARGRHANRAVDNILAGLATCPLCGGTMTRVNKGKRSRPSFVCASAKVGASCTYRSVRYSLVEEAIIERLPERLRDTPAGDRQPGIEDLNRAGFAGGCLV